MAPDVIRRAGMELINLTNNADASAVVLVLLHRDGTNAIIPYGLTDGWFETAKAIAEKVRAEISVTSEGPTAP